MGAWELTDGVSKADVLLSGRGHTDICDTCDAKRCEGTPFRDHLAEGGGGRGGEGCGTRPRYLIVCLWRRLLASRHCTF